MTTPSPFEARPAVSEPLPDVAPGPGWWLASDGRWYPPPDGALAGPTTPRRRRVPVWAWILGGVAVLGVLAFGAVLMLGLNAALTHQLLDERFDSGSGVFETGKFGDFDYQVRDGSYVITRVDDSSGAGFSYGVLARTAYVVHASVDVVSVPTAGADPVIAGVGCTDSTGHEGYMLIADSLGTSAAILRVAGNKVRQDPLAKTETLDLGRLQQVRLDCANANPLNNSVNLTAYVNGTQVLTAHEEQGAKEYQAMLLVMGATGKGAEIRFDNAKAIVPE